MVGDVEAAVELRVEHDRVDPVEAGVLQVDVPDRQLDPVEGAGVVLSGYRRRSTARVT